MTSREFLDVVIRPTLRWLGAPFNSPEAELLLAAIALVETRCETRLQKPVAHAKGLWQFELGGGCANFATNNKLKYFRAKAQALAFATDAKSTWNAIGAGADTLACIMARAELWPDPAPLPKRGDEDGAYNYYIRNWRPGKPSRSRFHAAYEQALKDTTL